MALLTLETHPACVEREKVIQPTRDNKQKEIQVSGYLRLILQGRLLRVRVVRAPETRQCGPALDIASVRVSGESTRNGKI